MTSKQSTARLCLYVAIAMLTAASSGVASVNFADIKETIQFAMGILVTGLVTARSYIDQTPTQIKDP